MTDDDALDLSPRQHTRLREQFMSNITAPGTVAGGGPSGRVRRTRRWAAATAAVGVVAGLSAALTIGGSAVGLGPVAFAVTHERDGVTAVRIVSTEADAAQMTRQLNSQGLGVTVRTEPSNDQLVGVWSHAEGEGAEALTDQLAGYGSTLELPNNLAGPLVLFVGRAPKPGESIQIAGIRNQLAPGGRFACVGLPNATPDAALQTLRGRGYDVSRWYEQPGSSVTRAAASARGAVVVGVYLDNHDPKDWTVMIPSKARDVAVQVAVPSSAAYQATIWTGFAPSLRHGDPRAAGC